LGSTFIFHLVTTSFVELYRHSLVTVLTFARCRLILGEKLEDRFDGIITDGHRVDYFLVSTWFIAVREMHVIILAASSARCRGECSMVRFGDTHTLSISRRKDTPPRFYFSYLIPSSGFWLRLVSAVVESLDSQ
jgi:hypothetical protein